MLAERDGAPAWHNKRKGRKAGAHKGASVTRPPAQGEEQASALAVHLPLEGRVGICLVVKEDGGPGQAGDTCDSPEAQNSGALGGTARRGQCWRWERLDWASWEKGSPC